MDEETVRTLVAHGETKAVDFKRELLLKSSKQKSEFVKDVIALANSAPINGYLLIGVDDDKYIVGVEQLPEEQIQQIAYTYITPPVELRCYTVPTRLPTLPTVGVIEVKATNKPHKVARPTDRLDKDDVFVRRGSVVSKASPEEIIAMYSSKSLEPPPNFKSAPYTEEKTLRLDRVRLFQYSWEEREKDLEWLKANTEGDELGEVLYWEVNGWPYRYEESEAKRAKPLLDQALRLGYNTPGLYALRAEVNEDLHNYGLALEDINKAISKSRPYDSILVEYFVVKARVLVEMRKFTEARETLLQAMDIHPGKLKGKLALTGPSFEDALLYRYALEYKFGNGSCSYSMRRALQVLALGKSREIGTVIKFSNGKLEIKNRLHALERGIPEIVQIFQKVMGRDLWQLMVDDKPVNLTFKIGTLQEQINQRKDLYE
jgi:hypothetical protein